MTPRQIADVAAHVSLVEVIARSIARRLPAWAYPFDELRSAGCEALVLALVRHPELAGDELGAYVRTRVTGAMLDTLRSAEGYSRRRKAAAVFVPLEDLVDLGVAGTELGWTRAQMERALEVLDPRDREVVRAHYLGDEDLGAIAGRMGVSEARISQLHLRALERLRGHVAAEVPA
jgi:RNA polymerase sigma factor (sigma-70 family)